MNKIAIVGHPVSGYEGVEALLRQCGVQAALPSRHEKLSPQDITAILCKAHKVPPLDSFLEEDEVVQIEAGPVWHGMALDLMLGNLEQELWGWADPQAIHALNYWEALDPKLGFVLVYDEPHQVLMNATRLGSALPSAQELRCLLDNWVAYNGAMLRFYLRHPGRSVLVYARQARRAADTCVEQLQSMLDTQLALSDVADRGHGSLSMLPVTLSQALSVAEVEQPMTKALLADETAERYLVDDVLVKHPTALQLYAELQSVANIPADPVAHNPADAMTAWEALVQQRALMVDLLQQIYAKYQNARDELTQITELKHQQIAAGQDAMSKDLSDENELLLAQLNQIQEELERHGRETQHLKQTKQAPNKQRLYGAADRAKQHLTYRLGSRVLRQSKTFWGCLFLLPALWLEVLAYRRDKQARNQKLPPIQSYADAYEAERVQRHLSWRLGLVVRRTGWNPLKWPLLPFALLLETRAWKRERGEA